MKTKQEVLTINTTELRKEIDRLLLKEKKKREKSLLISQILLYFMGMAYLVMGYYDLSLFTLGILIISLLWSWN